MNKLLKLVTVVFFFAVAHHSSAQNTNVIDESSGFKDRVFVGGNFGLSFGDVTNIQIAPIVGYRVTNELSLGLGPQYQYSRIKLVGNDDLTSNNYGLNVFARYNLPEPFFLQAEYEYLNFEFFTTPDLNTFRESFSSILVGGGIIQPLGGRAFINLTALYNLSYDANEVIRPYDSPLVVRAGISLGF